MSSPWSEYTCAAESEGQGERVGARAPGRVGVAGALPDRRAEVEADVTDEEEVD